MCVVSSNCAPDISRKACPLRSKQELTNQQLSSSIPPRLLRYSGLLVRCLVAAFACALVAHASAGTLPIGFTETVLASGLSQVTAMEFAPDGRLFVCEQSGRLRVIKNGSLLDQPFVSLAVDSGGERGLLGIAFDPNFS